MNSTKGDTEAAATDPNIRSNHGPRSVKVHQAARYQSSSVASSSSSMRTTATDPVPGLEIVTTHGHAVSGRFLSHQ